MTKPTATAPAERTYTFWDVYNRLIAEAGHWDDVIREAAIDAGFLWRCEATGVDPDYPDNACDFINAEDEDDCGACGAVRR